MENTTFTQLLNEAYLELSRQNPNGEKSDLLEKAQEMAYDRYDAYQESSFVQSEVYNSNWGDVQSDLYDMRFGGLKVGEEY
jgi:hypothetical protein